MERSPVSENRSPVKVHESHTTPENDDVLGNETDNNLMEEVEEEASVGHADKKIKLSSESDVKSCGDFEVLSEPRNVEKGNSSAPIEDESSVNNVGDGSYCAKPKSCFKVESVNRTEEGVDLGNENHDEVQPTIPSKRLCFIEAALKVINAKLDEMWACNCRLFDAITLCEKCLRPDSTGDFASMLKIESFVEACDAATNSVTPTTDSSAYQQLLAIISPQTSKRLMEATVRLQPREELNIICRKNNWAAPIYYLLPPTDVGIQYLVSVEGMDFVYSEFGEIETDIDKAKDSGAEKILAKLREMVAR